MPQLLDAVHADARGGTRARDRRWPLAPERLVECSPTATQADYNPTTTDTSPSDGAREDGTK